MDKIINDYDMIEIKKMKEKAESLSFFEDKAAILTMTVSEFTEKYNVSVSMIPESAILAYQGFSEPRPRELYVFDLIGISKLPNHTLGCLDPENFENFCFLFNKALAKFGLNTGMFMCEEQRNSFDLLVRNKEKEKNRVVKDKEAYIKMLCRNILFGHYPEFVQNYLCAKNSEVFYTAIQYISANCPEDSLNYETILHLLKESLKNQGVTLKQIRHLDMAELNKWYSQVMSKNNLKYYKQRRK